ncbi:TrlF family AAA-like ATPase [Shinella zoogloeoides]|uniref:TrlF family AAA-like ATPase n=1 Tax=Shinella zoogloeoides TaxID=352475 RepID=UPI001F560EA5|nr:AAA family ATPase [Shinella zoogloeoides]
MQTPFDASHWVGESFASHDEAAEAYIRRCYEVGLEVIAITEHNFTSKAHIPLLQAKAKQFAHEFGYELVIFPGFEFTANVGKGVHVLAIFEPTADLDQIDHILTECGVSHPRQTPSGQHVPSNKSLDEIVRVIQAPTEKGGKRGLVILPHIQSNSGIFDGDKIAEWLQQKEFTNPELLAVEVPKSPSKMSVAFQTLFGNGDDCHVGWKRARPICCLMSSDAKALAANNNTGNAIGTKYTWIKMSAPSIEALRQAFLDHESRVRRSDEHPERPELGYSHPFLASLKIAGAKFLANEEIFFSPNLNTLIGGRGTGKSTMVEYMRMALRQEHVLEADTKSQLYADFSIVRDTLALPGSRIEVTYDKGKDFENQKISLSVDDGVATEVDSSFGDVNTYLPVKIYSRGQIEAIANDPQKQASIIDDLILAPLEGLRNEERDLVRRLRDLNQSLGQEADIATAKAKLVADISNLNAQINAIRGKHSSLEAWSKWNGEKQYLYGLEAAIASHLDRMVVQEPFSYKEADSTADNAGFLKQHRLAINSVVDVLNSEIDAAVLKAKNALAHVLNSDQRTSWQKQFDAVDSENKKTVEELAAMGVSFDAYDELFRRRETAQAQLSTQENRLAEISTNRTLFETLYKDELLDIWTRQFELRRTMADHLNDQVTKTKIGTPTVQSEITKYGDFKSFSQMMAAHHKDRRVVSQADWEGMLRAAFDIALSHDVSPLDVIERWIVEMKGGIAPFDFPSDEVQPKKLLAMAEWLTDFDLNELRTHRIADAVTVSLHRREDGKLVGDLAGRKLSAGQKATTVLSLLLAEGTCPIIIDQPEDDLDNEFVFEQLVPMLRSSKEKRQIIVVTHNANVPVNGDAELIVPLEVRNSGGTIKQIDGELTMGALDRHPVQRAVELILEGSSEAFRRRREKYGV